MDVPSDVPLIEPFVGEGDLVKWANRSMEVYDIDPKVNAITQDTLMNPPDYKDKFIITNPPYLARNKNRDKSVYDHYGLDDLYKIAIQTMIDGDVFGGILIVPLNFICSPRCKKLRKSFLEKYTIERLNIFEENVFSDTSYTVCSLKFSRQTFPVSTNIDTFIYPSGKNIEISLHKGNNYTIGLELFPTLTTEYRIRRLVKGEIPNSNLYLRAIDSGSNSGRISLSVNENHLYGSQTDRTFATIQTDKKIDNEDYVEVRFNELLETYREKYHSLFLTNYRNSSSHYARKRISFTQAYSLIEQIVKELE
jgi:hypothetical protein